MKRYDLVNDYILVPPSIRTPSTLVHSSIGKSVYLRCSAVVPYDTKLYWRRMDNNTISKFRQQQNIHGDVTQISLHIKDIEKPDFGFYACFAESIAGQSHIVIELKGKKKIFFLNFFSCKINRTSSLNNKSNITDNRKRGSINSTYTNTQTK
jgi:hypothetical protein